MDDLITVRELLGHTPFGLRLIAATEHADRGIRWAHPTELLDPRRYLTGGELVLTVGSTLTSVRKQRLFVDHLIEAGVSALGYGVGDVTDEVPEPLVEACRLHGLPLLRVPDGVPFQNITALLADRRTEVRTAGNRRVQQLTARLLDSITADRPMTELLELIGRALGGSLTFDHGTLDWSAAHPLELRPGKDTLAHLARVLTVSQHGTDVAVAARRRECGRLAELVLQGRADPVVLETDLLLAGLDTGADLVAAAWPLMVVDLVTQRVPASMVAVMRDVALTVSADRALILEVATELALPVGIGDSAPFSELRRAIPPALSALQLARERGAPVASRELTTFESLLERQSAARLAPYAEQLVRPLADHDAEHGSALVPTLRAFLACEGSAGRTAAMLFTHANTVRYRLRQIRMLTGRDPKAFDDLASLAIGLWVVDHHAR